MFRAPQMLIERCIRREEKAWKEFIERFSGLLYYSARERLKRSGILFGQEDIEDIVQAVFLEIWEKGRLGEVREREKISAWLSIMAQTRALNHMRRKKERLLHQEEFYKIDNIEAGAEPGRENPASEISMEKLERIIEGFSAKEKIIFKSSIIYGKTHREIAQFMNMPINTVSTIIARKKNIIKKKLK
ncbi:RNA polymerase sigma factor [Candidatus Omnitrophota bacterium]